MSRKTKWVIALITALVIANTALLVSIWFGKKREDKTGWRPPRETIHYLEKALALNSTQVKSFDSLRKGHFEKMNMYQQEMRILKDSFFEHLNKPTTPKVDSLAHEIGSLYTKIDLETFSHFSQLRSLLNSEQTTKFDRVIKDILHTMGPRNGPPGNRRPPPMDNGGPPPDGQEPPPH